jgi:hypothetical protein
MKVKLALTAQVDVPVFLNFYACGDGHPEEKWSMVWPATCNDRCPQCDHEIEPYDSRDATDAEAATIPLETVMECAHDQLDRFRAATQGDNEYGITLFGATSNAPPLPPRDRTTVVTLLR